MTEDAALPHRRALLVLAGSGLMLLMVAGGAPSPLYSWYQERIGFSAGTLTMIFAIYAIALLLALIVFGALSDYLGRRPVLVVALLVEAIGMAIFIPADSVGTLLLARTVQGIATGAAVATYSAALIDTQRPGSNVAAIINATFPSLGLGIGALFAGFALLWAAHPAGVVFGFLTAAFVVLAIIVALSPETGVRRPGAIASMRPTLAVPAHVRPTLLIVTPTLVAIWAIGGLFFALGPSLAIGVFRQTGSLAGASVIATMTFSGALMVFAVRAWAPMRAMITGASLLIVGPALLLAAVGAEQMPLFSIGAVVTGAGFSSAFYGVMRSIGVLLAPGERAGVFSIVFVINYLAFSLPAVAAGVASQHIGLRPTVVIYGCAVIVLAAVTMLALALRALRHVSSPHPAPAAGAAEPEQDAPAERITIES